MFFDPLMMIVMLPGILLGLYAQTKLRSTYGRWSKVGTSMTGAEAARIILDRSGLSGMPVNVVPGHLTDHYDPMKKALFLSEENYHGNSVAAVGVAAHEAGHALQHRAAYFPLHLRMALVPVTGIATNIGLVLVMIGFAISAAKFVMFGLILFAAMTLFHLVTLPVEFDASRRAKAKLVDLGIIREDDSGGVSKVLNAAAMTYVAALVTSALQLLYFFLRVRSMDDRS